MAGPLTQRILDALPEPLFAFEQPDPPLDLYFDREGEPLGETEFWKLWHFRDYRRVAETYIGGYRVSTIWLGIDHSFGGSVPVIFETMVFEEEPSIMESERFGGYVFNRDLECERYTTEAAAQAGHERICAEIELHVHTDPRLPANPKGE